MMDQTQDYLGSVNDVSRPMNDLSEAEWNDVDDVIKRNRLLLLQQQQQQQQQQQPPQAKDYVLKQSRSCRLNKLICSFKSDLPNEIDFAMQVATLLANSENFIWSKDYPLVDAICSSLHVFVCLCGDSANCYCYPRFWRKILTNYSCNQYLQAATVPPDMDQSFLNFDTLEDHDWKDHTKIYKRIKAAAELLKQFSMTVGLPKADKNEPTLFDYHQIKKKKLKASPSLLKFISLLFHCDDAALNLLGYDILSNIAAKLAKVPDSTPDVTLSKLVQMFQERCVENISRQDGDIYIINRSIEVLSRLISSSSRSVSSNMINYITEKNLVFRLEQFLTSHHDVTLFLSALECCYRISRHQAHLLTAGRTRFLIKILMNLLNCDDSRYFTPKALKRIKLVDEEALPQPQPPPQAPVTAKPQRATLQQVTKTQPKDAKSQPVPQIVELPPIKEYTCEWDNCNTKFTEPKQVYAHVFKVHIEPLENGTISSCLWSSPNGSGPGCITKRPKYSLLTHLNDFHCNQVALERVLNRCQPIKPPEHPGYAPNAAFLAIRRHANANNDSSNGSSNLTSHSPLSISVRLTAALILRNLATESLEVKQALENHEPLLSEICMTNGRDESKIIAECLSLFSSE